MGEDPINVYNTNGQEARCCQFSPDAKRFVTCSQRQYMKLWDIEGNLILKIDCSEYQSNILGCCGFFPDGKFLFSATWDGKVCIWRDDGKIYKVLYAHRKEVYRCSVSPSGRYITSSSRDQTTAIWTCDGTFVTRIRGHKSGILATSWSPDESLLLTSSQDKTWRIVSLG